MGGGGDSAAPLEAVEADAGTVDVVLGAVARPVLVERGRVADAQDPGLLGRLYAPLVDGAEVDAGEEVVRLDRVRVR